MSGRLAIIRHAFHRLAGDWDMVSAGGESRKHNARRALAHWRVIMDKVASVQMLVGLEESVHSWLPQAPTSTPLSPMSSEQLAEAIITAEPLAPMKTKTAPAIEHSLCRHKSTRLATSHNQYSAWIVCWDCHSRWKIAKELVPTTTRRKPPPKEETKGAGASSADRYEEEIQS